jgi:hypothetical protein
MAIEEAEGATPGFPPNGGRAYLTAQWGATPSIKVGPRPGVSALDFENALWPGFVRLSAK